MLNISTSASDGAIDSASFTTNVSKGVIPANASLRVYRYHDGEWQSLESEVRAESSTTITLDVETPGFSFFVVGNPPEAPDNDDPPSDSPSGDRSGGGDSGGGGGGLPSRGASGEVELESRTLLNETVTADAPVVVAVDLANFDPSRGTITLSLMADDSTATERTVAVGASSERTVFLETRLGAPGTYELMVNGASVGSVTVEANTATLTQTPTAGPGTPTPVAEATPASTPSPTSVPAVTREPTTTEIPATTQGDGAGFGPVLAVIGVVLLSFVLRRD
jgi:hypothetical protein